MTLPTRREDCSIPDISENLMTKRMLIDAGHPEETRVVIVDGTKVEELDFESAAKKQLRGNLYLARVTRVEPSLQAAFVEYGGNRHGFLAFSEIHPDYYQIPYEDRMALLEAEEAEALKQAAEEEAEDDAAASKKKSKSKKRKKSKSKDSPTLEVDAETEETKEDEDKAEEETADNSNSEEEVENSDEKSAEADEDSSEKESDDESSDSDDEVAAEQAKTAKRRRARSFRHRYKIQEVIKRGQILLIQVVKEERGNKGAAMTTYLSLAGRYCVLMPNTPKGGGISRKIANGSDRKRLKSIVSEFKVPQGMGVIVRTAGAKRTKTEIKRDYDYLCRLWETTRTTTLESIAPALIHEEGNLVKRSIRDLYNKDIKEVLVQGDNAYKTAKDFIKMLMPSHAKNVKAYKDEIPLFLRYQVESQIEDSLESVVQLKSGGYLVIHPTEALVSIDVNSGRSTKERNVERTALKTNLEAADEVARQMRLRDLAGLVVIDFIDMDEYRNNRSVEKRMKDALSQDRARVQSSRISQFGLMEISRQRRRRSLLEGSTISCPHCEGVGRKRTIESSALKALRALEELAARAQTKKAKLKVSPDVAAFVLNQKRDELQALEDKFELYAIVEADPEIMSPEFLLTVEEKNKQKAKDPLAEIEKELKKEKAEKEKSKRKKSKKGSTSEEDDTEEDAENDNEPKKRRRRGRRGGRRRKSSDQNAENLDSGDDQEAEDKAEGETSSDKKSDAEPEVKSKRRRSRKSSKQSEDRPEEEKSEEKPKSRRSRSRKKKPEESADVSDPAAETEDKPAKAEKPVRKGRRKAPSKAKTDEAENKAKTAESNPEEPSKPAKKPSRSTTRRKAPARKKAEDADEAEAAKDDKKPVKRTRKTAKKATKKDEKADKKPKRTGWWSKKS